MISRVASSVRFGVIAWIGSQIIYLGAGPVWADQLLNFLALSLVSWALYVAKTIESPKPEAAWSDVDVDMVAEDADSVGPSSVGDVCYTPHTEVICFGRRYVDSE